MTVSSDEENRPIRAVSFDLFGTLIEVERPADPAHAVGTSLEDRGITIPSNWTERYRTPTDDLDPGAERSLYDHVIAILESSPGNADLSPDRVTAAVDDAFEPTVDTVRPAPAVVQSVSERVPVAICSNSSIPKLVDRAIARSDVDREVFDTVIASVDCGFRKPDRRAFERVAKRIGVDVEALLHVGDDPDTDGGIVDAGGQFLSVETVEFEQIPDLVAEVS